MKLPRMQRSIFIVILVLLLACLNTDNVLAQDTPAPTTNTATPTPGSEREPSSGQKGTQFFFSQEVLENTVPLEFQNNLPKGSGAKFEGEAAKHMQSVSLPEEVVEETKVEAKPEPSQNIFQIVLGWLQNLLNLVALGPKGFVNSYVPAQQSPSNVRAGTTPAPETKFDNLDQAADYVEQTLFPEEFNPDRFPVSFPASATEVRSVKLKDLFQQVSGEQCVPIGILLAISHREWNQTFAFSDDEVERFSENNWRANATRNDLIRTACTNTCDSNPHCGAGDDVRGPMQFEIKTWNSHVGQIKLVLEQNYGIPNGTYEPDRCNVRDAIIGAAIKIKGVPKSESSCTNWGRDTVYRVAENYCGAGACSNHPACGVGYCAEVWGMYNNYMTPETM